MTPDPALPAGNSPAPSVTDGPPSTVAVPAPPPADAVDHAPVAPAHAARSSILDDLPKAASVIADIDTDLGMIQCELFRDKAPVTVTTFVGLATGEREWTDPRTKQPTHTPAYDGTSFHRVIPGFMIQGGDPKGDGTGEPGFTIKDEIWPGSKHDRPGLLCMANRGHDTNGAQFFITDASAPHLDGNYTIFGQCAPVSVVHNIANVPADGSRPKSRVGIRTVTIILH